MEHKFKLDELETIVSPIFSEESSSSLIEIINVILGIAL